MFLSPGKLEAVFVYKAVRSEIFSGKQFHLMICKYDRL